MKYRISIKASDLTKISKFKVLNLIKEKDIIFLEVNKNELKKIKNNIEIIEIHNIYKKCLSQIVKKYWVSLIGILMILNTTIFLSTSITKIKFINDNYDIEVYEYINDNMKKVGPFLYCKKGILELNKELRKKFYSYEWISITKKGTTFYVNIEKNYEDGKNINDTQYGNIYSNYDAIIIKYHIEKGTVLIKENQSVTKGDKLISGEILHYNNQIEQIHPIGYVIGEVTEYKEYTIRKKYRIEEPTGQYFKQKVLYVNNRNINKIKNPFDNYYFYSTNIVKLWKIRYTINEYYECKNNLVIYSKEETKKYVENKIINEVSNNEHEKIIKFICLEFYENDEDYYFKYLIKSHKNIGLFVKE